MPDPIALIVNPSAGGGRGATAAAEAAEHLRAAGLDVQVHATTGRGDGGRLARDAGDARAIVAVGGDGTFNEILNGARGRDVPLGLIPVGTANVLARELGIPRNVSQACALIAAGHCRTVDVGLCNDRRFILMAGIGFDAAVVQELARSRKGSIRLLSYAAPILRALATYGAPLLRVEADGHLLAADGHLVIVSNARNYAIGLKVSPEARMDDGLLDVCVFRRHGALALLRYAAAAAMAGTLGRREVVRCKASELGVSADGPVPCQLDGDLAGHLPVRIRALPQAARILCTAD